MAKLVRSLPRRSPRRYPLGTTLTLRDGRTFEVVPEYYDDWTDPENPYSVSMSTYYRKIWQLVTPTPSKEKS